MADVQIAAVLQHNNARACSSCNRCWQRGLICVHLQTQQKLDNLAQQADANAMANIKGEEHVFTNNPGYMDLLNKMKSYIMRKQEQSALAQSDAPSDEDDEVSTCGLPQVEQFHTFTVAFLLM